MYVTIAIINLSKTFIHSINSFFFIYNLITASPTASPVSGTADFNRSIIQQRSLFGNPSSSPHNYANPLPINHNTTASGPPTQSLFDSLRIEQNSIMDNSYSQKSAMGQRQLNQSLAPNQSYCDSYLNQSNFNVSR